MAKIIEVLLNNQSEKPVDLSRRQIIFEDNDLPTMVLEFEDLSTCLACETKSSPDFSSCAETDKVSGFVEASSEDLSESLCQIVPCISCRLSVERLFKQLVPKTNDKVSLALDPIQINHEGQLTINSPLLMSIISSTDKLDKEIEAIANKSKKNKRCAFHSAESQNKTKKKLEDWTATWNVLSSHNCVSKLLALDSQKLLESLNVYLRKNKFCSECKLKVLIAYKILTNECQVDDSSYKPSLYEGLKCCVGSTETDQQNNNNTTVHIHLRNEIGFIEQLICKAELEILGGRPERHATTIASAQEEVLICIGAYLYERIMQIGQSLKVQEQTWNILFHVSLNRLIKNFQIQEEKSKEFNIDLICAEFDAIDKQKRDQSRKKDGAKKKPKQPVKKSKTVEKAASPDPEPKPVTEDEKPSEAVASSSKVDSSCSAIKPQTHTCLSSNKAAKLKMTKNSKQCRLLSSTRNRERPKQEKPRKNIELNLSDESCKCDDETAFSHELSETSGSSADSKCTNSCCFDIIEYWNKLTANFGEDEGSDLDEKFCITDEEKNEYFSNKAFYLTIRTQRRELLKERFEELKLRAQQALN